ncbi:hypothetical protein V490_07077 [Pseudogymnoascus sp. VKM F-3557]|nr:hypothetical protein V490_07077 [Pseudogymnoascus sp. VKM F-3557]
MSTNSKMALLTEHLRHTPVSLLDDIIDSINKLAWKAVDAVEQGLSAAPPEALGVNVDPSNPKSVELEAQVKLEIEAGAHKLETLLGTTIDKNFDKMEVFALRSIVAIPDDLEDWIRLPHYEGLNFKLPADAPTIETIRLQRAKVQEAQRLNRLLTAETSKNTAIINRLRSLRGLPPKPAPETSKAGSSEPSTNDNAATYPVFAHLENKADLADGTGDTPLSTNAAFVLSQLPALKSLLAELKPQEKLLVEGKKADPNIAEVQGEKSWRKQRVEYIETQTRRHLEKVVGLELGKNGEVGDGEWQADGRKLAKGEVQDLEKMVEMMGGGGSEGKDEKMTDV